MTRSAIGQRPDESASAESLAPTTSDGDVRLRSAGIVIANFNGIADLPGCLDSLRTLEYPQELVDVIVVDNGSTDGSSALLRERYPWVQVLEQDENLGFAPAVNIGAEATDAECLVLLNNDMQVEPGWLRALMASFDPDGGYVCVGGTILDWDGSHVDFVDGVLNWHGMGDQVGFGRAVEDVAIVDGRELLFACGGAMLVDRALFLELGGLDPEYFAYFEDVDFGWRLWLSGYRVRLAADARCRHRHNGTSSRFPFYQRALLYERNALRSLIKNVDDDNLGRLVGPAVMLLVQRALSESNLDRRAFDFGASGSDDDTDRVPRVATARLSAIGDLLDGLDELMATRRRVQLRRRASDADVLSRFGQPFKPLAAGDTRYLEAAEGLRRLFRLEEVFTQPRATRMVVLAYDRIGERMAGPAVRSWEIATALARLMPVTLLTASAVEREAPGVQVIAFNSDDELRELLIESDVVLVHGFALQQYPSLKSTRALLVVDLYDPWVFENLEMHRHEQHDQLGDHAIRRDVDVQAELLDHGDFFVCASERQRDYWLGMLTARGRVDRAAYAADPSLRALIDVLPFGCPESEPERGEPVLKGVHPAIADDDIVITWGGGTWEWFDPVLVLEAFVDAHRENPRLRLFFMGLDQASGDGVPRMRVAARLRERADELGLTDRSVVFGDWAPYDERGRYLLESDIGIIATKDLAEVRLAFRSRLLDHFWAGLPTIATEGDTLADVVRENDAGLVVPVGNREALTEAMLRLATDDQLRARQSGSARGLGDRYRWSRNVGVLRPLLDHPARWQAMRSYRTGTRQLELHEDTQALLLRRRHLINERFGLGRIEARLRRSRLMPVARWVRNRMRSMRSSKRD